MSNKANDSDSKVDPWLAKVESISDRGSTSGKMYFRIWEKKAEQLHPKKGVRIYKRNSCADTKVSEEGKGGNAPDTAAERILQAVVKTMVRKTVCAAHGGPDLEQICCQGL